MDWMSRQLLESIGNATQDLERLGHEAPRLSDPGVVAMSRKFDRLVMEWYRRSEGKACPPTPPVVLGTGRRGPQRPDAA